MSSSAFSLAPLFPAASFAIAQGEMVNGGPRGPTSHIFCPRCLMRLFTRPEGARHPLVCATVCWKANSFIRRLWKLRQVRDYRWSPPGHRLAMRRSRISGSPQS
ncbi:hypothetical protein ACOI8A_13215 [Pseudomonas sp. P4795]